jgi:hypothetical protein
MKLDTVWIRKKSTGEKRKINAIDYASDLGTGKYAGFELIREQRGDKTDDMVSGESVGVQAQVQAGALANAEQNAVETQGYKRAVTRRKVTKKKAVQKKIVFSDSPTEG